MIWAANVERRLFYAISRYGLTHTKGAATGVNTASPKRSRISQRYRGGMSDPFQPIEKNIRASYDFYAGENRLRSMGDSMTCCGIDGLEGFKGNDYNLCMMMNGKNPEPTENMKQIGTGGCFQSLNQIAGINKKINNQSFYGLMQEELAGKTDYYKRLFGLEE